MKKANILITGSAGAVGYRVALGLQQRGHSIRGFDLRPQRLAGDHHTASLLDFDALQSAAEGMDVIVHIAGAPDRREFASALVPNNIVGTHNVFEVARLQGVARVVNTSSIRVVAGLDWDTGQIGLDAGFVPGDHYGVSKTTGEVIAEMYSRRFDLSVISVRLGWFVRNHKEAETLASLKAGPRIYLSHEDAQDFYVRAVEHPAVTYAVVFVTSYNGGDSAFDLEATRKLLGYSPKDSFPEGSVWSEEEDFPSPQIAPSLVPALRG